MINSVKQAIVNKLLELYPGITIYDEDIPQNFKTPSFLITVIDQEYSKRLDNKYKSTINFDVAYFSNKAKTEIKGDCLEVQLRLLRNFDLLNKIRALEKQATITDNVLHLMFKVKYSELKNEEEIKINSIISEVNVKE